MITVAEDSAAFDCSTTLLLLQRVSFAVSGGVDRWSACPPSRKPLALRASATDQTLAHLGI